MYVWLVAQLCLTPCDPMGSMQPARLLCPWDSQARTLEWVAMPSSRGSSRPRDQTRGLLHCRQIL